MARSTDDVATVAEVARRMGRHPDTIKRWIREGKFPGYMPSPGEYVICRVELDTYFAGTWVPRHLRQRELLRLVEVA